MSPDKIPTVATPEETTTLVTNLDKLREDEVLAGIQRRMMDGDTNILVAVVTGDGFFDYVNPTWTGFLGWKPETLKTKSFYAFIHPDDQHASHKASSRGRHTDQPAIGFFNRYRTSRGDYLPLQWMGGAYDRHTNRWYAMAAVKRMPVWLKLWRWISSLPFQHKIPESRG